MSLSRLPFTALAKNALVDTLTHATYWVPALVLLSPALLLQLAAPTYLRTRLAPAIWTVIVGSALLVWLAQGAWSATCALVHAARSQTPRVLDHRLLRLSFVIGTRTTLALAAGVLPGLWLQARYAFALLPRSGETDSPASRVMDASFRETRAQQGRLLLVAGLAFCVSVFGQSAAAVLAEAMGAVSAAGQENGQTIFRLRYASHALTTVLAYICAAGALTFHAVGVSMLFDEGRSTTRLAMTMPVSSRASVTARIGMLTATAIAVAAIAAFVYKVHQQFPEPAGLSTWARSVAPVENVTVMITRLPARTAFHHTSSAFPHDMRG